MSLEESPSSRRSTSRTVFPALFSSTRISKALSSPGKHRQWILYHIILYHSCRNITRFLFDFSQNFLKKKANDPSTKFTNASLPHQAQKIVDLKSHRHPSLGFFPHQSILGAKKYSFFCKIRQKSQKCFFKKFPIPHQQLLTKPMENSVDNMENPMFSRGVFLFFYFDLWKTQEKILSSLFQKKIIFHVLHKDCFFDKKN